MVTQSVFFDENELKQVVFSAALMSSIDRDVQERDWEVIQSFAGEYWKSEFEDFTQFQKRMFLEIKALSEDEVNLYETIDHLITSFGADFSRDQKSIVLSLMGYLLVADGIEAMEQSKIFRVFVEKLGYSG